MARNAKPLLPARPLPELHGGVELLIVESLLGHPDPTSADGYEQERSLCVLALVSPTEIERRWLRAEAQRYVGAQATVVLVPGADWAAGALQVLSMLAAAFLDVVVGLREHTATAKQQVATLMHGLKAHHFRLCTAVLVTQHAGDWAEIAASAGLVVPHGIGAGPGAIALHAGLAQVSAPQMIACVTTEAINEVVRWRPGCPIMYATDSLGLAGTVEVHGRSEHGQSRASAAALFIDDLTLAEHRAAMRTLREAGFEDPVVVAGHGLTVPQLTTASPRCVFVVTDR